MRRVARFSLALVALVAVGCSSGGGSASRPTYRYSSTARTTPRAPSRATVPLPAPQRRVVASPPPVFLPPKPST